MKVLFICEILVLFVSLVEMNTARGSDITFAATPATVQPLLTDVITLRCSLKDGSTTSAGLVGRSVAGDPQTAPSRRDASTVEISHVNSMVISHDGVDVAFMSEHHPATSKVNTSGVQVSGQIPGGQGERGILQVIYRYPTGRQSGNFTCDISGIDNAGHSYVFTKSVDVTEMEVVQGDLIDQIHDMKVIIDGLTSEITTLKHNQQVKVHFTASLSHSVTLIARQVLVFDHVITNVGGGYDSTTGLFTCPEDGHYLFEMHILSQKDKDANFELQLNQQHVLQTDSDPMFDSQSASNSAVLSLRKGDIVRIVSSYATSYAYGTGAFYTSFTGSLVSLA